MEDRRTQDQKANVPKGSEEPGARMAGREERGLLLPTQDPGTEQRRQHDGEMPKFFGSLSFTGPAVFDVNNVKTPNNPTRDERIRGANSGPNPETGYARAMTQ